MSKIKSVINFTGTQGLTSANFPHNLSHVTNNPSIAIVNSINYYSPATDAGGVYLIYCNINNAFIGSFAINGGSVSSVNCTPFTTIYLENKTGFGNDILFTIYTASAGNALPVQYNSLTGFLSISIDFIEHIK
jgi:hypothetical protein